MIDAPRLSLVVPAFNEEHRLSQSLQRIGAFLGGLGYATEVIVVDDGSAEAGRKAVVQALDVLPPEIARSLVSHEVNRGKGAAVRSGSLAARGAWIAFIDADLATPPEDLPRLLAALEAGADVAIGVRNQEDGSDLRDRRPLMRRLAGRGFAMLMRNLLLPDVNDSQCPLKAFQRKAALRLFRLQKIDTWAFDAELLYLAARLGLRLDKVPVRWQAMAGSHLRLDARSAFEVANLLRIRWTHRGVNRSTLGAELAEA